MEKDDFIEDNGDQFDAEDPGGAMEVDASIVPTETRGLRACLLCSLIKTFDQFYQNGCENCESVLPMAEKRRAILDCTTNSFNGVIAYMKPESSWVVKWQRMSNHPNNYIKGMYAVSIDTTLPEDYIEDLRDQVWPHGNTIYIPNNIYKKWIWKKKK